MNSKDSFYGELNNTPNWYALHTRGRHEKKVSTRLEEKGVTHYLPLNTTYRRWSDRYKKVSEPLFSCYVFVNMALRDRLRVLQTDGAVNLVIFNSKPAVIPEKQILAIKKIVGNCKEVKQADYFTAGKKVRVVRGPLKELEGTLVSQKNEYKLVIAIDGIKQAISVEIDMRDLELIKTDSP